MTSHTASCHCGLVQIRFEAPEQLQVTLCNCSICHRTGYEHVFIPQSDTTINGHENLSLYTFGTGAAKHYFCKNCGIKPFYIPRSHPDCYSVNLRCIDGGTLTPSETIRFDGQDWEGNVGNLRSQTDG